jgi:flagellar biosynthesis/type III secretory pathway chaperone
MMSSRSLAWILLEIGVAMDSLLDLSSRKTDILTAGDVAGLEKLLPAEQDLVQRLGLLEEERVSRAGDDAGDAAELLSLRESLREKAKRIALVNGRNQSLLRQGLEIVQYEMRLLLPQGTYGNNPAKWPLVFDHRV